MTTKKQFSWTHSSHSVNGDDMDASPLEFDAKVMTKAKCTIQWDS